MDHCNAVTVVNLQNQIVPQMVTEGISIYSHTSFTLLNSKKLLPVNWCKDNNCITFWTNLPAIHDFSVPAADKDDSKTANKKLDVLKLKNVWLTR